jgi:hypothetical protein
MDVSLCIPFLASALMQLFTYSPVETLDDGTLSTANTQPPARCNYTIKTIVAKMNETFFIVQIFGENIVTLVRTVCQRNKAMSAIYIASPKPRMIRPQMLLALVCAVTLAPLTQACWELDSQGQPIGPTKVEMRCCYKDHSFISAEA